MWGWKKSCNWWGGLKSVLSGLVIHLGIIQANGEIKQNHILRRPSKTTTTNVQKCDALRGSLSIHKINRWLFNPTWVIHQRRLPAQIAKRIKSAKVVLQVNSKKQGGREKEDGGGGIILKAANHHRIITTSTLNMHESQLFTCMRCASCRAVPC